ncbi:M48 family metallopeptidase [Cohnella lubricantis]|uniref:M48 family metallopeptidase n=1 Tax=Cohnella lubricantis TaxID=2163172 RepID=A0A841TGN6_9BACL|nr:M48 family metallopeptidase [Cohnella lubricantis]MBB6679285.1 M48 family metallopeptidase [Cohnella lubricantis]MBP2120406.1 Zn-dependent protease with chaperone function [Cohnella lubricantis]
MRIRSALARYVLLFSVYAILMAAYVWCTSSNDVPDAYKGTAVDPATFYTPEQLHDSERLNALRNWIFFMSGPWEWLIYLALLTSGIARKWKEGLERTKLLLAIRFPIYVFLVSLFTFVLYLPLRIFSYALSKSYGITTQPASGWMRDKLVEFGVSYITYLLVTAVLFWLLSRRGRWWLKLWLISIPFTLFTMYIQPVVIDPLYNQFSRLTNPELERQILSLAADAGIHADRVYEVAMSAKTNAMNAYVTGIGPSLRIVLWDTTLQKLNEPEILLIMAHEIGHYAMHHLEWSAVGAVASSLVMLRLGAWLYEWLLRRRGERWGIRSRSDLAALPLLLLLLSVLSFVSLPITNAVSRQAEAAADRYGMRLIGNADAAIPMYQGMAVASLSDVNPPLLVRWFRDTHPSDMERMADALRFNEQR